MTLTSQCHPGASDRKILVCDGSVAFTGGIGENDPVIRATILDGLAFMGASYDQVVNLQNAQALHDARSRVAIWTVAAQEEAQIAREATAIRAREAA